MSDEKFAITISHQLGSGGANLGKALSERLGIPFVDRDILQRVAQELNMPEPEVERRADHLSSLWDFISHVAMYSDPAMSVAPNQFTPSDKDLFELESKYIERIANAGSAVILGRCGWHILRDHPCRISLLVFAALPARIKRVSDLYHVSADDATRIIETNDKERAAYIHAFTRRNWLDANLYDLCLDTSRIGFDRMVELVTNYIDTRLHS
jgi:cytidylate kinase